MRECIYPVASSLPSAVNCNIYHCEPRPAVAACADGGPPLLPNTPCTVEGWLVRYGGMPPRPGPPRPDAACDAPELFAAGPDPGVGAGAGLGIALRFPGQSKKPLPFAGGPPRGGCDPLVAPVECA